MNIELESGRQLLITKNVLEIFNRSRQFQKNSKESGGILIGQVSDQNILISRATSPNKSDTQGATKFIRNKDIAQEIIEYEFQNSEMKNIYLGEWHTHPAIEAHPSSQDLKMIKEQFKNNQITIDFLILIILGKEIDYLGICDGSKIKSKNIKLQS